MPCSQSLIRLRQVTRTLLNILADLNRAVMGIDVILPLIFSSPNLFCWPLWIVQRAQITIGITGSFMYHNCFGLFFLLSGKIFVYIFAFFFFFSLYSPQGQQNPLDDNIFFLLINTMLSHLANVLWSIFAFFSSRSMVCRDIKIHLMIRCLLFCWLTQGCLIWPTFGDLFVSLIFGKFDAFHF